MKTKLMIAKGMLVLGICVLNGCSTLKLSERMDFDITKQIPWSTSDETPLTQPDKVIAIWTDTVLQQTVPNGPSRPPTRGFGGRLMFYNNKKEASLEVDGTLTIYAFVETDRAPDNDRPDRKFVFTPEQLKKHYSKSRIGHSYSIWLPWDKVGGEEIEISLVVRFTPNQGGVAVGEPSRMLLPGRQREMKATEEVSAENQDNAINQQTGIQQTGYQSDAMQEHNATTSKHKLKMQTTTINLPNLAQHQFARQALERTSQSIQHPATQHHLMMQNNVSPTVEYSARRQPAYPVDPRTQFTPSQGTRPSVGYSPQRSRPLGGSIARIDRDHAAWQRFPTMSRPAQQPSLGVSPNSGWSSSSPNAGSASGITSPR